MSEWEQADLFELVVIESPYAGAVETNLRYLRAAMADCLARGEAPYASHALYTQPGVLDDTIPAERIKGITAGFAWGKHAARVVVYADLGVTKGMAKGIEVAEARGIPVEHRSLPGWKQRPQARSYECTCPGCGRPRTVQSLTDPGQHWQCYSCSVAEAERNDRGPGL